MANNNLSSRVYSDIKGMLINLAFAPGDLLREQVLADMLGVSRTPVREAFQRLAHEGWLQIGDGKRVQVTPVTVSDVKELFQLRSVLEPYAAKEAYLRGKSRALAGKLDEVLEIMQRAKDDRVAFAQLDMRFHLLLMQQVENERLNRFWKTIHEETSRVAVMTLMDAQRYERVIEEHSKMLNAFWEKDVDAILSAVNEHLIRSRDALTIKMEPLEEKLETHSERPCNIYPLPEDEISPERDNFLEEMAARFKA
ncbi:GntR family transcriptional regulator [Synergistaceae bacterium OttesenSCG-928-I11]|nr:GntR family transcriptional regulator [Synergistaceae bacterium OttesenSCG-928-I11]